VRILLKGISVAPVNHVPFKQVDAPSLEKPPAQVTEDCESTHQGLTQSAQVFEETEDLFKQGIANFYADGVRLSVAICPQTGYLAFDTLFEECSGQYEIVRGNFLSGWFVAKFMRGSKDAVHLVVLGMHIGMWSCKFLAHGLRLAWADAAVELASGFLPKDNLDQVLAHINRSVICIVVYSQEPFSLHYNTLRPRRAQPVSLHYNRGRGKGS
jgi:hypothetical protein